MQWYTAQMLVSDVANVEATKKGNILPAPRRTHYINVLISAALLSSSCFVQAEAEGPAQDSDTTIKEIPYQIKATNSSWEDKDVDLSFYDSPYQVSLFSAKNGEDSERLLSHTYTVLGLGVGVVGFLYAMPESVTNWDKSDSRDIFTKWADNVSEGPVWDRDDVFLNYIAHPYFGGVFYQTARKSGYRQWDSFLYSTMMSSFYWEYGVEAFAEVPSVQDLVVTPVIGWAYGEWAFQTEHDIWLNDAKVMDSEVLGNISLFMLDPVDSIGRNINYLFGEDIIKSGTGYFVLQENKIHNSNRTETEIGLKVTYIFGDEDNKAQAGISKDRARYRTLQTSTSDPVDTGIIGISGGGVWVNLDKDLDLKPAYGYQFSVGLYFTQNFSSRLAYTHAKMESKKTNDTTIYENYGLDSQYYFNSGGDLRPFVTAGFGESLTDEDNDTADFIVNTGLGIHYKINNKWAVQTDLRHYYGTQSYNNDDQIGAAIIYRFGKGEWSL